MWRSARTASVRWRAYRPSVRKNRWFGNVVSHIRPITRNRMGMYVCELLLKRAQFFVNAAVPEEKQETGLIICVCAKMLGEKVPESWSVWHHRGLPIGGLAVGHYLLFVCIVKVNRRRLPMERSTSAKRSENQYAGVFGKLDQSCEVLSKKNHLM